MEVKAVLLSIPFGFVFLFSGLIINLIQGACYILVQPLSKTAHRRIIGAVTEILWLEFIFLMDWWSGFKVHLHTDFETYQLMGKEHALLMPNHICDADIFIMWLLAQRSSCLRGALMVVKRSSMYIPIYGWATWFAEHVFVSRNWGKDEEVLKSRFQSLQDFPRPFWLTLFVEGTRMTSDKLVAAQNFATSKGLPVPRNVLIPRTKGFVAAVRHMRSFVPAIYDITLAVPRGLRTPSLLGFLGREPTAVQIHIKRYSMKELPESDEAVAQWCRDKFVAKDNMLDEFQAKGTFENQKNTDIGRPRKSLIVLTTLGCIICLVVISLIQRYSLLSTRKGVISLAAGLALDAVFLHAVIEYTKLPQARKASMGNLTVQLKN
ncbi:1-acylglycerol-3-phosphate acyltransferase, putative [Ricinus communis]|uniref:1-acylglycerol-3-phosphate O-acyltransferase n=1 Tax=Ricinus communis TaxID=3988 RepID=B9RIB7_RICCO|nr:1-acylglycerol-3-phosphate acyltransferase, putative [Ricinus communis]|eukprot:XP_002513486.1 1-acyl-sn-glycerol-3-phosphate acyltransferase 2 isoform X1 [Ricinus communis]